MIPLRVTFLGTGAVHATARRGTPATLIVRGGDKWLFDCGEGTQAKLWAATGGLPDLDGVFLTHYHADHTLGLIGMVSTMALWGRKRPLSVYGPPPLRDSLSNHVALMSKDARKLIRWCETPADAVACQCDEYEISTFPVLHAGGKAIGYKLHEFTRPGKLDASLASAAGLTGPEMGRLKKGETVKGVRPEDVIGPDRPGRSIVITGDTAPSPLTVKAAQGADLLIHDSTYLRGQEGDSSHSTAWAAGEAATKAGVKRLALYHIAARNKNSDVLEEARQTYSGELFVPHDLVSVDL